MWPCVSSHSVINIKNYFPYQNTNKVNDEDYVLINDTLGKFDLKGNYKDVWVLDSLYDGINKNYNEVWPVS